MSPSDGALMPESHPYSHPDTLAVIAETPGPESDLAVVIPTHNNELAIGSLVLLARRYAAHVVVADGGSTDRTVEVARDAGAEIILSSHQAGRSGALLAGCRYAVGNGIWAVALLDPRENHLTREIPSLAAPVLRGEADLAIGSRTLPARKALYVSAEASAVTPFRPSDPSCTFRVLGPRALELLDILPDALSDDAEFETAMTLLATRLHLAVAEQPVTLRDAVISRGADDLPLYRGKRVAVVVPAHNEELLIGETLGGIPDFVARVYVVNDCSSDRTAELVDHYAAKDSSIRAIHHETNQGVGAAIVTGYRRALEDGMEVIAVMAGDNQMDPAFLPHLLDPIVDGKCDYTMGNRLASFAFRRQMSKWRFFGNAILTLLTKIASGYWQMVDPQNGYTAISARALEQLDLSDVYPRYGYCNDILVKLNIWGFKVINVPHPARYGRETSGIRYSTYIVKLSRLLLKDFLLRLKSKYIVMSFHPLVFYYFLGAILIGIGLLGGLYSLYWRLIEHNPIFVPAVVSLIVFVLGTQYWLFAMLFDMRQEREDSGWY